MRDTADHINEQNDETEHVTNMMLSNSGFNTIVVHPLSYSHVFRDEAVAAAIRSKPSLFKFADGTNVPISWRFKDAYHDEYTREILPHAHITESIVNEVADSTGMPGWVSP